jgi:hypothetical protein
MRAQGAGVSRKLAAFGHGAYWGAVAGPPFQFDGHIRSYFIQAEEVQWDYLPLHKDGVMEAPLTDEQMVFFKPGPDGTKFKKCLYVGYTDATFRTKTPREGDYQGIIGPVIRAAVRLLGAPVLQHWPVLQALPICCTAVCCCALLLCGWAARLNGCSWPWPLIELAKQCLARWLAHVPLAIHYRACPGLSDNARFGRSFQLMTPAHLLIRALAVLTSCLVSCLVLYGEPRLPQHTTWGTLRQQRQVAGADRESQRTKDTQSSYGNTLVPCMNPYIQVHIHA